MATLRAGLCRASLFHGEAMGREDAMTVKLPPMILRLLIERAAGIPSETAAPVLRLPVITHEQVLAILNATKGSN
jgi:hypothetical protein